MLKRSPIAALLLTLTLVFAACTPPTATSVPVPPTAIPATAIPPTIVPATIVPTSTPRPPTVAPPQATNDTSGTGNTLSWLSIYFTNPTPPDQINAGIDKIVVAAISRATKSLDVTSFDFTLPSVADALIAAHQRGLRVRVIYDGKNGEQELKQPEIVAQYGGQPFEKAKAAGIPMVDGGRSNGLMHNKMIIIDGTSLFMGSLNLSYNDTFRNNNNLLLITNPKLIENYQAKFNEGFERGLFGTKALLNSPNPKFLIGTIPVEQYFSPDDKVMSKVVAEVNAAQVSVKFMIFTYTHPDLSAAMIARFKAGVKVEGVIENRGASQGALVPLACAKVPVLVDGNSYTMHHKVIIIDDSTLITGSYNFTQSAETSNDDNVLIIRSKSVVSAYLREYARVYGAGKPPNPDSLDCTKVK